MNLATAEAWKIGAGLQADLTHHTDKADDFLMMPPQLHEAHMHRRLRREQGVLV